MELLWNTPNDDCSVPNCHHVFIKSNFFNLLFALESHAVVSVELVT